MTNQEATTARWIERLPLISGRGQDWSTVAQLDDRTFESFLVDHNSRIREPREVYSAGDRVRRLHSLL